MEENDSTVNQSSWEREPSTMSHGNLTYEDPEVEIGQQLKDSTTGKLLAMTEMLSSYPRQASKDEFEDPGASEEEDNALSRLECRGHHVQETTASTPRSEQGRPRHGTSEGRASSSASSNHVQLPRLTLRQGGGQPSTLAYTSAATAFIVRPPTPAVTVPRSEASRDGQPPRPLLGQAASMLTSSVPVTSTQQQGDESLYMGMHMIFWNGLRIVRANALEGIEVAS